MAIKSIKELLNTGIVNKSSNGGRYQEIIFVTLSNSKYRIQILSESYKTQSYARLHKWIDDKGWEFILGQNPLIDYNIDISYKTDYNKDAFKSIIKFLTEFSNNF